MKKLLLLKVYTSYSNIIPLIDAQKRKKLVLKTVLLDGSPLIAFKLNLWLQFELIQYIKEETETNIDTELVVANFISASHS